MIQMENGNERPKNDVRAPTERKEKKSCGPSLVAAILVRLRQLLVRFLKNFHKTFNFGVDVKKLVVFMPLEAYRPMESRVFYVR